MKTSSLFRRMIPGLVTFGSFLVLVGLLLWVDVRPVGPMGSLVGLAGLNRAVRDLAGSSAVWRGLSTLSGLVTLGVAGSWALTAMVQLLRRGRLGMVDADLRGLGLLYGGLVIAYGVFEVLVLNYRPVLVDGVLEASFPSSHCLLAVGVLGSSIVLIRRRMAAGALRWLLVSLCWAVMAGMVTGRLASGLHWFTDIAGGVLLGGCLVQGFAGLTVERKSLDS